jgi:hypothetical protein
MLPTSDAPRPDQAGPSKTLPRAAESPRLHVIQTGNPPPGPVPLIVQWNPEMLRRQPRACQRISAARWHLIARTGTVPLLYPRRGVFKRRGGAAVFYPHVAAVRWSIPGGWLAIEGSQGPVGSLRRESDAGGLAFGESQMLAMELIPAIRTRLEQLDGEERDALTSGRRAALWRAQQYAARINHTLDDLRRYCLESLKPRRFLDAEDENDYLRGYREGFQAVLTDIRRLETRQGRS